MAERETPHRTHAVHRVFQLTRTTAWSRRGTNPWRIRLALVTLLTVLAGCGGGGASGPVDVDVVKDFGATASGETDDEPAIQAALDHAAVNGGGTVRLPAGVYGVGRPLVLRSNVRLTGVGPGKSVVRPTSKSIGKVVEGTGVWAVIAAVAADNAHVADLTVDLSVHQTHANGVALLPSGQNFEGTPSTNCTISGVEVIGGGNYHSYMIWNLRGRHIRITDNLVDGRVVGPVESYQEGIESYGGYDVLIRGNTVKNIGNTALNFGSAGLADSELVGLEVTENSVSNSSRALNIGPGMGTDGSQNVSKVKIAKNDFRDLWKMGIQVSVEPGTRISDLQIEDNIIESVGTSAGSGATAIFFRGSLAKDGLLAGDSFDTIVSGNQFAKVRGANAIGLLSTFYPNLTFRGNTLSEVGGAAIQAIASESLEVTANTISDSGYIGLVSRGGGSLFVRDNVFEDWGLAGGRPAAVSLDDLSGGDVLNNTFRSKEATGSAVRVERGASNVAVIGNVLSAPLVMSEPFVNLGALSNLGSVEVDSSDSVAVVANDLVEPSSRISLWTEDGNPAPFSALPEFGSFRIEFTASLPMRTSFRYEIVSCRLHPETVSYLSLVC